MMPLVSRVCAGNQGHLFVVLRGVILRSRGGW